MQRQFQVKWALTQSWPVFLQLILNIMKLISFFLLSSVFLYGCGEEKLPSFNFLSPEAVASLPDGERACYEIAQSLNILFPDNPTHCTLSKEKGGGLFKESYSFILRTSNKKTAEWNKWGCLSAGKLMNDGAKVGMEKIYLKSNPSEKYSSVIDAYICRDLQRKAYSGELSEFEVLKYFNARSSLKEMS